MKTVAIIQARIGSTRLPGKVLLPLGKSNPLQIIVDKCKTNKLIDSVIVAIPDTPDNFKLLNYCLDHDIRWFSGSEHNVLSRVYKTAIYAEADVIIDITGDCPLIDLNNLHDYIGFIKAYDCDYVSNVMVRTFPDGLDLQVYTMKALRNLMFLVDEPKYQQHTGWNFQRFANLFKMQSIIAFGALNWPELRITLDTKEDYLLIQTIIGALGQYAEPLDIINFLKLYPDLICNKEVLTKTPGEL